MPQVRQRDALGVLNKPRLLEIATALGLGLPGRLLKAEVVDAIAASHRAPFPRILEQLKRDELKAICCAMGLDDSGRKKTLIADRILGRQPDGHTPTVTKAELIEAVAAAVGVTKRDAEVLFNTAFAAMVDSIQAGESIEIRGFGTFGVRQRGARPGRNPKTGEPVHVPAKRICTFKPGKTLRLI